MKKLIAIFTLLGFVMLCTLPSVAALAASNINAYDEDTVNHFIQTTSLDKLQSRSALLVDLKTDTVLFSKKANERQSIASLTKIMTMLLIMEAIDSKKISLADKVTASEQAYYTEGSQVWLDVGEVFTVRELMEALAVHSANDAGVALAEYVAGSENAFVQAMNDKAKAMGLKNTQFMDCSGLIDMNQGHFSTANDLAKMSKELLLKHPKILEFTKIVHKDFRPGPKVVYLDNTNKLLTHYTGTIGLKTGFTTLAGYNLIAVAERDGRRVLSIIMGADSSNRRYAESIKLLDDGFVNYQYVTKGKSRAVAATVDIKDGAELQIKGVFLKDATLCVRKKAKVTGEFVPAAEIKAPIKAGQSIGKMTYKIGTKILKSFDVVAEKDMAEANIFLKIWRWIIGLFGLK
ncbi:MAG: D-alanyl-D-alanine carboxypeptidase family protein [Clostridia bacterium]